MGSEVQQELEGCWTCSRLRKCSGKQQGGNKKNGHENQRVVRERKKPAASKNSLKKHGGKSLRLGELPSFCFRGLMLTHTCIHIWFHMFTEPGSPSTEGLAQVCNKDVGQVLADNLALPSPYRISFSLMFWARCPVLMQALKTGWVVLWGKKIWIFLTTCGVWGFVPCKIQERCGFPRPSLQCNQLHHIVNRSDRRSLNAVSLCPPKAFLQPLPDLGEGGSLNSAELAFN